LTPTQMVERKLMALLRNIGPGGVAPIRKETKIRRPLASGTL